MKIEIIPCDIDDLDTLVTIGKETYHDSFRQYCSPETMQAYLEEAFDYSKMLAEVTNENSLFYFVYVEDELAGYLKLNINTAQTDLCGEQGLELERIYVRNPFQGMGIGKKLINLAFEKAREYQKEFVWLGVLGSNMPGMLMLPYGYGI